MAWLRRLDRRASKWPKPARWSYLAVKWYLVATAVIAVCGLAITELRERRVGFGTGVIVMVTMAFAQGIIAAIVGSGLGWGPSARVLLIALTRGFRTAREYRRQHYPH